MSRLLCARVKRVDAIWLPRYLGLVYRMSLSDARLASLFTRSTVLVPVPSSRPCAEGSWTSLRLARALTELGLAPRVWAGLRREAAVRRSATAPTGARPTVYQHYWSFSVQQPPEKIRSLVLIDDVITRGRTLLAAAARLQSELPSVEIRAFALIRTQGFVSHLNHYVEVCHGVVRWGGGDARREP